MVDAHQGSITVESYEKTGTTFTIKLPKDARSTIGKTLPQENLPSHVEQIPQVPMSEIHSKH